MLNTLDLFDLEHTIASDFLSKYSYPWLALPHIKEAIIALGETLGDEYEEIKPQAWVHKSVKIAPTAFLGAPLIISADTEIRQAAFIRGSAIIGKNCVIGNSVEIKNAIIFDNVQVPHFNYVGDSILGYKAHMGGGSITSNIKSDKTLITIRGNEPLYTEMKKIGAMVGDYVEIGCNAVLNPGTIVGRNTTIYPLSCVRGVIPENSIFKHDGTIITKK